MKQKDAVEMENASIKVATVRMDSMVNTVAKNIAQKIAVDVVNAVTTEFVNAMFEIKDEFQDGAESEDKDTKDEAYKTLVEFVKKYIEKFVRLDKNKYMRERIYYQRSGEVANYEKANMMYNQCREN